MSSAFSFQWHLCDVFKVTYLISFDTIHYHLDSSLAHYFHRASLSTLNWNNIRGILNACLYFCSFWMHDKCGFIQIFILFHPVMEQLSCMSWRFFFFFFVENPIFYLCFNWLFFSFLKSWIVRDFQCRYEWGHFRGQRVCAFRALFQQKAQIQLCNFQSNYCWVCII